jgi:hypothetical protein
MAGTPTPVPGGGDVGARSQGDSVHLAVAAALPTAAMNDAGLAVLRSRHAFIGAHLGWSDAEAVYVAMRAVLSATQPPTPQDAAPVAATGCACRWLGEVNESRCELHEAWHVAIHEWADRAKAAEARASSAAEVLKDAASLLRKYHRLCVGAGKGDGFWLARILEVEAACRAAATPPVVQPTPALDAKDARIVWPKENRVGRREDMSPDGTLIVGLDNDNGVYVEVSGNRHGQWQSAAVEFCNGGGGGGQSSLTRAALINLMTAIEADNAKSPHKAFPPAGPAGTDGSGT